jgi:hypothetical protein
MTSIQVAALESFLRHERFEYFDYDAENGSVIYIIAVREWRMRVVFGDHCYYYLDNEVTNASISQEFTQVCEVMATYSQILDNNVQGR